MQDGASVFVGLPSAPSAPGCPIRSMFVYVGIHAMLALLCCRYLDL